MDKCKLNLKKYIGTKVVEASPMNEIYAESIGYARKNSDNHEWRNGYHVMYTNPDGSFYDSWSPKSVFEKAYHEVKGMNFGEVIEALRAGLAVRRECWSGNKFLYYVPAESYPAKTDIAKSIADKDGKGKERFRGIKKFRGFFPRNRKFSCVCSLILPHFRQNFKSCPAAAPIVS